MSSISGNVGFPSQSSTAEPEVVRLRPFKAKIPAARPSRFNKVEGSSDQLRLEGLAEIQEQYANVQNSSLERKRSVRINEFSLDEASLSEGRLSEGRIKPLNRLQSAEGRSYSGDLSDSSCDPKRREHLKSKLERQASRRFSDEAKPLRLEHDLHRSQIAAAQESLNENTLPAAEKKQEEPSKTYSAVDNEFENVKRDCLKQSQILKNFGKKLKDRFSLKKKTRLSL